MADPLDPLFLVFQEAVAGRYSLERELGRGGMGVVYLAREVALDRWVAIKLLPPHLGGRRELRQRFLREARTAARLSHPHVIPIHAVDEAGDFVFFAMAYIDGETLGQRIRTRGPLPPGEGAKVLREIAWALAYAHAQGVVHRDVKPDNILLERATSRALIGDFGIALVAQASGLTEAGELIGTAEFMSPEQASGRAVDARSDLYALGVVAYYALSGRLPFEAATVPAVLAKHLTEPAPLLASKDGVPRHVAAAVDRCLAKDPGARFASAEEFAEALGAALELRKEVPVPVRVFLRQTVDRDVATHAVGVLVLGSFAASTVAALAGMAGGSEWAPRLASLWLATFGLVTIAVPLDFLVRQARRLMRAGHGVEDVSYALKQELTRRREEVAFEYGREAGLFERVARATSVVSGGAVMLSATVFALTTSGDALHTTAGVLLGMSAVTGLGAAAISFGRYARRTDLKGEVWAKFLGSRFGRWLFKLAGVGLRGRAIPTVPTHRPTELAIGTAVDALFEGLPKELRRELHQLPEVVRQLEADAQKARRRVEELSQLVGEVETSAPGAASPLLKTTGAEGPVRLGERRETLLADLRAVRDLAERRLADAVAALEAIRLDLLRFHAGAGSVDSLTADLAAAREVGEEISRLIEGRREVEAVLEARRDASD